MTGTTLPRNSLLAAVGGSAWSRMQPSFHTVRLSLRQVLLDEGEPIRTVHFPVSGVVSTVATFRDGGVVEMATVGTEGMIDIGAALGSRRSLGHQMVQVAGEALAVDYGAFQRHRRDVPAFDRVLGDYVQAYLVQQSQTAACNAVHSVQARAARWLLSCDDRKGGQRLRLTQQFLAEMLGVTRATVGVVARSMQEAGLIRYARGTVAIEDRPGLERVACECYRTIRNAYRARNIGLPPDLDEAAVRTEPPA
jgi:CRP-like cAMP-binding protein